MAFVRLLDHGTSRPDETDEPPTRLPMFLFFMIL